MCANKTITVREQYINPFDFVQIDELWLHLEHRLTKSERMASS